MSARPVLNRIVRHEKGGRIVGTYRIAFIHNWDYHVAEIKIYADGIIDCWELVDFEGFKRKVREGWVVTRLPEGARVHVWPLGSFLASEVWNDVPENEFVKEVADLIEELQGRVTSSDRCLAAWEQYKLDPSVVNRSILQTAYELVPAHLRDGILGDQDIKDFPIREAIYGPEGIPPEAKD